ncbi:WXG100 family type VII secretion target [Vallitalea sp.]|jgi:WXG100 family type VII secretion target|uniref:WXG100 family type VII secretion target n=1 Tax=Vallitalea sp. TaxID=1882829 RepID=UPI0025F78F57|nr:WXG100 family type VII secretion target [Vallitalea sp.]MCT4686966.1 WXG100 family type VII secretion target [Vallitalea sp.]
MSRSIDVTPGELEKQSGLVTQKVDAYKTLYEKLMTEVNNLDSKWKGEGNAAYAKQITNFRPQFEKLEKVLRNYAEFLMKAANVYRKTEENIVSNAGKLAR